MGKIERKIVESEALTIYSVNGLISSDEVVRAITDFYEKGPVTKNVLWDFVEADLAEIQSDDVQKAAKVRRSTAKSREGGKTAIVAPEDLSYGLCRMYQAVAESGGLPFQLQVFRDLDTARDWMRKNEKG